MKTFPKIIPFIVGGFVASFISLLILASTPLIAPISNIAQIIFNGIVEEFVKLLILGFVLKNIQKFSLTIKNAFVIGTTYGLGFTLFEIALRSLNHATLIPNEILYVLSVHTITSALLFTANHFFTTKNTSEKLSTNPLFYLILAIFIHLCYNLSVQMMF